MTTSFKDTMGAKWYEGYDDKVNTSNFVAIKTMPAGPAKDKAIAQAQEEIIGLLEQKGVTRDQILNPNTDVNDIYEDAMKSIQESDSNVDTRNVFQDVAYSTTSGADRGDTWGGSGRDYISNLALTGSSTGKATATEIADLYRKGFNREPDAEGLTHWLSSGQSLSDIATAFKNSEEAGIRSAYSDEYGRDVGDEGLNYWMNVSSATDATATDHNAFDATKLVQKSLSSREYGDTQFETSIRDQGWNVLGQASSQAQRDTMPTNQAGQKLFTDMETEQVLDWVSKVRSGDMSLEDVGKIIADRGDRMDAFNEGDSDDYTTMDINGDGIISENEKQTGSPTGMGRFASLKEIQETIDSGETPDEIRERLGGQQWGLLTHENQKELKDFERTSADFDKYRNAFTGNLPTTGGIYDTRPNLPIPDSTIQIPDKPGVPPKTPVDRTAIDYMPDVKSDSFNETPYGAAKKEFDTTKGQVQAPTQPLASPTVAQRFTGTSAKGVALKRSKRSKMGTIGGTRQLTREQQTQSLNI